MSLLHPAWILLLACLLPALVSARPGESSPNPASPAKAERIEAPEDHGKDGNDRGRETRAARWSRMSGDLPAYRQKGALLVKYRKSIPVHKVTGLVGKATIHKAYRKSARHEVLVFDEAKAGLEEVRKDLLKDPEVEAVEPNVRLKSLGGRAPDFHKRDLTSMQWSIGKVNRRLGRNAGTLSTARRGARKIRVGILDTGLDFLHPDLDGNVARGVNLIHATSTSTDTAGEDGDATEMDYNGHGTMVAGIIGAEWNNEGVDGLNEAVELVGIKAFDQDGYAAMGDVIAGIRWAIENRIDVLNMSFGTYQHSALLEEALDEAAARGMVLVAAAGNDYAGDIMYPARFPAVLSAGSHDEDGTVSRFSNWDPAITVFAPGGDLLTTNTTRKGYNNSYEYISGTSAACAYVTGVVTHLVGRRMRGDRLAALLHETAILRRPPFHPHPDGFPELNVDALLARTRGEVLERATVTGIHGNVGMVRGGDSLDLVVHVQNTGTRPLPADEIRVEWTSGDWSLADSPLPLRRLKPGETDSLRYTVPVPPGLPADAATATLSFSTSSGSLEEEGATAEVRLTDVRIPVVKVDALWLNPLDFTREDSTEYTLSFTLYNSGNAPMDSVTVSPFLKAATHCGVPGAASQRIGGDYTLPTPLQPGEVRTVSIPVPDFKAPPQDLTLYARVSSRGIVLQHATQTYKYLTKDQVRIEYDQNTHKWIVDQAVRLLRKQGIEVPELEETSPFIGQYKGSNNSWTESMGIPCSQLRVYGDGSLYKTYCEDGDVQIATRSSSWSAGTNPDAPYWGDRVFSTFGITPTLINGAYDCDQTDIAFNYDWEDLFDTHFWIVENNDDDGLNSDGNNHHSALTKIRALLLGGNSAQVGGSDNRLIKGALDHFRAGHKKAAYWFLGHALHLIGDLTVPSHVRNENEHGVYGSAYHDWMDHAHGRYTWETALERGGFVDPYQSDGIQPVSLGDPIRFLAYTAAQFGDAWPWASWKTVKDWTGGMSPSWQSAQGDRRLGGDFPHYNSFLTREYAKHGISMGAGQNCNIGNRVTHSSPYCVAHINKEEVKDFCAPTGAFCWCCTECQAVDFLVPDIRSKQRRDCWNGGDGIEDRDNTDGGGTNFDADQSLHTIGQASMNYAIRAAAGLLYWFVVETGQHVPHQAIPHVTGVDDPN